MARGERLLQLYEESRYFYTIPGRGIAALIQGLTRILTSKPACEAWSKGLSGAQSLSLALPYSCWYALAPPYCPKTSCLMAQVERPSCQAGY
jgi:hypothetical protein